MHGHTHTQTSFAGVLPTLSSSTSASTMADCGNQIDLQLIRAESVGRPDEGEVHRRTTSQFSLSTTSKRCDVVILGFCFLDSRLSLSTDDCVFFIRSAKSEQGHCAAPWQGGTRHSSLFHVVFAQCRPAGLYIRTVRNDVQSVQFDTLIMPV